MSAKLSPRDIRAVCRRGQEFPFPSRNAQVLALSSILFKWTLRQISLIFDINDGTVHRIRALEACDHEACLGNPTLLASNEENQVIVHSRISFDSRSPLSLRKSRGHVR
jgi:hypothetical protein